MSAVTGLLQLQGCTIDLAQRRIERTGTQLRLTEVWGYTAAVNTRTIDTTVRRLRQKIERDPLNPEHLLTAYGVGYRLSMQRPRSPALLLPPAPSTPLLGRQAELAVWLSGTFDSSEQAAEDYSYYAVQLVACPVEAPELGANVLYIEQALADTPEDPYRQRLYVRRQRQCATARCACLAARR